MAGAGLSAALRLARRFGIDRAVTFTLLGRGWAAISGLVTLALLTRFLSRDQQGLYYTFGSVLNLVVFFELGLTFVIMQFASHERAKLEWASDGTLQGEPEAKARLAGLLRFTLIWYGILAVLVVATILPLGLLFFGRYAPHGVPLVWRAPWVWTVLLCAMSLALTPLFAVLEGCGLIAEIAKIQMVQLVLASLLNWTVLCQHWALFAAPFSGTLPLLLTALWLWRTKRVFLLDLVRLSRRQAGSGASVSWRQEIWPFQWKMALSGMSGYLVFSLFNPVLLATRGASAAGQLGLCLNVMSAISTVALAWITTKSAIFGTLIAKREFQRMDRIFFPCLWYSWAVVVFGGTSFWLAALYLHHIHHHLATRILAPLPLGLLVLTIILYHGVSAEAIYLRAHKQEPLLWLSVTGACLIALLDFLLGRRFGATGLMAGYLAVTAVVGLGGGTWLFTRKRREWHGEPQWQGGSERQGELIEQ